MSYHHFRSLALAHAFVRAAHSKGKQADIAPPTPAGVYEVRTW